LRERGVPVVLDFSRATFIDSTRVRALLEIAAQSQAANLPLKMEARSEAVWRVLELTSVRNRLPLIRTTESEQSERITASPSARGRRGTDTAWRTRGSPHQDHHQEPSDETSRRCPGAGPPTARANTAAADARPGASGTLTRARSAAARPDAKTDLATRGDMELERTDGTIWQIPREVPGGMCGRDAIELGQLGHPLVLGQVSLTEQSAGGTRALDGATADERFAPLGAAS
jgi:hypothetical protein